MDIHTPHQLEAFFDDIAFPVHRHQLIQESQDWPLSQDLREALLLLPEHEYSTREEIKNALLDRSFDDGIPKKELERTELEEVDDHMDSIVPLDDFTQMGDEEDHESV